jgi:hypothetical protein
MSELFGVDRRTCAEAVMRNGRMEPCGLSTIRSPPESERPWGYCVPHARRAVLVLDSLASHDAVCGEVWRRIRAEEIRVALETA